MYSIELEKKIVLFTDDDQKRAQIEERKEKIDALMGEISEISRLTGEINNLVDIQGESVDQLEENVEKSKEATTEAHEEIKLADKYLTKRNVAIFCTSVTLGAVTGGGALALIGLNAVGGIASGIIGTGVTVLTNKGLSKL
jgi:hypothetical protein